MRATRVLAAACLVVMLVGCSTSAGEGGGTASQSAPVQADTGDGLAPGMAQADGSAREPSAETGLRHQGPESQLAGGQRAEGRRAGEQLAGKQWLPIAQRQVVRDATVELRVDNVAEATERARRAGPDHGGFVAAEESAEGTTSLTLRVASAELEAALNALAELGEVTSRTLTTQDVTEQTVDLAARIASQRASVERVRALLVRATTIGEVVQVESELTWRQAELKSLQQRAAALADQVALSIVRVRLEGPQPAAVMAGGFGSGLAEGWDALGAAVRIALMVLGAVLPFAAALALPVAAALFWYRRRRRAAAAGG